MRVFLFCFVLMVCFYFDGVTQMGSIEIQRSTIPHNLGFYLVYFLCHLHVSCSPYNIRDLTRTKESLLFLNSNGMWSARV